MEKRSGMMEHVGIFFFRFEICMSIVTHLIGKYFLIVKKYPIGADVR